MRYFTVKEMADILGVSKTTISKAIKDLNTACDRKDTQKQYYTVSKAVGIMRYIRKDFDVNVLQGFSADELAVLREIPPFEPIAKVYTAPETDDKPQTEPQTASANSTDTTRIPQTASGKEMRTDSEPIEPPTKTADTIGETVKPQVSGSNELELMRSMLQIIQEQLKEKDKQLQTKDKQISELNSRLEEALKITHAQQYLTAADKQAQLTDIQDPIGADAAENNRPTAPTAAEDDMSKRKRSLLRRIQDFFKD